MEQPIEGDTVAETEKRWHAIAKKRQRKDLDRLLAVAWPATWQDTLPRARALAKRPRDPRITGAFVKLLDEMPWTSRGSIALWKVVAGVLGSSRDPDARRAIERLLEKGTTFYDADVMERLLRRTCAALVKAKVKAAPRETPMPAPISDEARAVQADALLEKGDPRGELIALQCAPPTRASLARQKALLKAHEKSWLGGLAMAVRKGSTVWERGVLVACVLDKKGAVRRATGDPALTTVRRIGFHNVPAIEEEELGSFLTHPVLAGLRAIDNLESYRLGEVRGDEGSAAAARGGRRQLLGWRAGQAPHLPPGAAHARRDLSMDGRSRRGVARRADLDARPPDHHDRQRRGLHPAFAAARRHHPAPELRTLELRYWRDAGSLVYDFETRVAEIALDRHGFGDCVGGAKDHIELVRVRPLRTKVDLEWIKRGVTQIGAKLEISPSPEPRR